MDPTTRYVITTAAYRAGQAAAQIMFTQDPDATPLPTRINRRGTEFAAGFNYRWQELKLPYDARTWKAEA